MKKILTSSLFFLFFLIARPAEYYYMSPDGKTNLNQNLNTLLVGTKPGFSALQLKRIVDKTAFAHAEIFYLQEFQVYSITLKKAISDVQWKDAQQIFLKNLNVRYANPVFENTGSKFGVTDNFYVKTKTSIDFSAVRKVAESLGALFVNENKFEPNLFHFKVIDSRAKTALDLANVLAQTTGVEYAEPDFLLFLNPDFVPNDPFVPQQWSLENLGAATVQNGLNDADMDVQAAWNITTGTPNITIAIIDDGVDLNHHEFAGKLVPGFDAIANLGGAANAWDNHGTACAGIAAANGNNGALVAGVAFGCKLMPVRFFASPAKGMAHISTNQGVANAINFAWQNGADVLSNSWSGGPTAAVINTALTNAVTLGRNGKGALVLFASGNTNNTAILYPSNRAEVITVGATSMCDQRKSPTSCDGENFWGSNFGNPLDVMAPGVKIFTTDNLGVAGTNPTDFNTVFNGTSAACPNAAGVCALILSANNALTGAQARQILESNCDKVGGVTYTTNAAHPNGSWQNTMGYGRINANNAVMSASPCGNPPTGLFSPAFTANTITVGWNNMGAGVTYIVNWQQYPNGPWLMAPSAVNNFLIPGLLPFTPYNVVVQSVCPGGALSPFNAGTIFWTMQQVVVCAFDQYENNNLNVFSRPINMGVGANTGPGNLAVICPKNDLDFFHISNSAQFPGINLSLTQLPANYRMDLYSPAGALITYSNNPGTMSEYIFYPNAPIAQYWVKIYCPTQQNNAQLYYRLDGWITNSCTADNYENNDLLATAYPIASGTSYVGNICPGTDVDHFSFTTDTTSVMYRFTLSNNAQNYDFELLDANGLLLRQSMNGTQATGNRFVWYPNPSFQNSANIVTQTARVFDPAGVGHATKTYQLDWYTYDTTQMPIVPPIFKTDETKNRMETKFEISLRPNPTKSYSTLQISTETEEDVKISIVNMLGEEVKQFYLSLPVGENSILINTDLWSKGIYLVRYNLGTKNGCVRLVKSE